MSDLVDDGGDEEIEQQADEHRGFEEGEEHGEGAALRAEPLLVQPDDGFEEICHQARQAEGQEDVAEIAHKPYEACKDDQGRHDAENAVEGEGA